MTNGGLTVKRTVFFKFRLPAADPAHLAAIMKGGAFYKNRLN